MANFFGARRVTLARISRGCHVMAIVAAAGYADGMISKSTEDAGWTARQDLVVEIASPEVAAEKLGRTVEALELYQSAIESMGERPGHVRSELLCSRWPERLELRSSVSTPVATARVSSRSWDAGQNVWRSGGRSGTRRSTLFHLYGEEPLSKPTAASCEQQWPRRMGHDDEIVSVHTRK